VFLLNQRSPAFTVMSEHRLLTVEERRTYLDMLRRTAERQQEQERVNGSRPSRIEVRAAQPVPETQEGGNGNGPKIMHMPGALFYPPQRRFAVAVPHSAS
jgi:hypothetical protein